MSDTGLGSRAGSQFGPYRLVRLLGRGGMGEVYEAEDTRKHRVVALKLISPHLSDNPVFRERLQREADSAGRLTEPHVVPIHDYGEIDGQFYVEMRLIDGTDLRALLRRSGPMSSARAVAIVRQIASALDAAHATGITHRDVKPENILVTGDEFAYLLDFGIARAASDTGLTQTGMAVGTYNYMAPERFSGAEVTYRADIYALACVLDECLTGAPPFKAETIERAVAAHLMEPAPRPSQIRPGAVPVALDAVIAKGMAKNPADRYNTATELATAAHDALTTAEQHQAATILRDVENAAPLTGAVNAGATGAWPPAAGPGSGADTMFSPVPPAPPAGPGSGADTMFSPVPPPPAGPAAGAQTMFSPVQPPRGDQTMVGPAPSGVSGSWRPQTPAPPRTPVGPPAGPDFGASAAQPARKRKLLPILVVGAAAALLAAAVAGYLVLKPSKDSSSATSTSAAPASGQTVLPFDGLSFRFSPGGVALDAAGNVYVTNQSMYGKVIKLAPGSNTPEVLPFSGLYEPQGVTVDNQGAIYVTDFNNRVVKLPVGSNNQVDLPITGLHYPEGLAVDNAGNVYVADRGNDRVVKLEAGSNTQIDLPFTSLNNPDGVAVDDAGNVFITDSDNNRILKLPAGSDTQVELPFKGLAVPWGISVDHAGTVYVTEHENHKVVKLPAGSDTQIELPFVGLNTPLDVGVGSDGTVYVADRGNNRVVKLPA